MLAGSALDLQDGLVAQSAGGCGGRVAPSPGSAGGRLAGWRGSDVEKFIGPAKAGGAGSRWLGELVEAILLGVGGVEELAHPPDALFQLLTRELVQAGCGCLGSAHVLRWGLVDGWDGAEGPADRSSPSTHVGDPAGVNP